MHILPDKSDHAAANMATDQALLTLYPESHQPRFRHYSWTRPAYTFGFAQDWGTELEALSTTGHEVIRRETGGGLVDHRNDWTYALVIPLGNPRGLEAPASVYAGVHTCLVAALKSCGFDSKLNPMEPSLPYDGSFRSCFTRAEINDVITPHGEKIAGAAQRRSKPGFLIQGYIDQIRVPIHDWNSFRESFAQKIAHWLQSDAIDIPWPTLPSDEMDALTARFASERWNLLRKRD